mmetsp:Transcript_28083/g.71172  ORF Transcript_28083/g.71172 Transcript_28083/m.71172 type:complete len:212 (-) Transcript_28083:932-1567(-)
MLLSLSASTLSSPKRRPAPPGAGRWAPAEEVASAAGRGLDDEEDELELDVALPAAVFIPVALAVVPPTPEFAAAAASWACDFAHAARTRSLNGTSLFPSCSCAPSAGSLRISSSSELRLDRQRASLPSDVRRTTLELEAAEEPACNTPPPRPLEARATGCSWGLLRLLRSWLFKRSTICFTFPRGTETGLRCAFPSMPRPRVAGLVPGRFA